MEGWVKLWRSIFDWEWFDDSDMYKFYSCLFIMANHEDTKWQGKTIFRGQLLTSRDKLANRLNFSVQQVRTMLKKLQKSNEIEYFTTNKYTIITICNYDKYQNGDRVEQPTNNQQTTNKQPTNNQQITTNNNDNNDNNVKNGNKDSIIYTAAENFESAENENQNNGTINEKEKKEKKEKSCAKKEKAKKFNPLEFIKNEPAESRELLERWLNYKQAEFGKTYKTESSFKAFIKRLNEFSGGNFETAKAIIEQSIANCYQGIFELKKQYQNGNTNNQISMQRIFEASEAMREYEQQLFSR